MNDQLSLLRVNIAVDRIANILANRFLFNQSAKHVFGRWFLRNVSSHSAVSKPRRRSHVDFCERREKILLQIFFVHFYLRIIVNNFSRDRKSKRCQYSTSSRMSASREKKNEQSFREIFIQILKGWNLESNMRKFWKRQETQRMQQYVNT